jgi:spectinomycin phosphotransferase
MRDDPGLDVGQVADCLDDHFGIRFEAIMLLPLGYDASATVHREDAGDGRAYFLKLRCRPAPEPGLLVPDAPRERGVPNILAPLRTRAGCLWCSCGAFTAVLYPILEGRDAAAVGLSDAQWRACGATLRGCWEWFGGSPAG